MKSYIILLVLCVSALTYAQQNTRKADELFNDFKFTDAIEAYNKAIEKADGEIAPETMEKLATCYFNLNEYKKAKDWYEKLYKAQQSFMTEENFTKYIACLRANNDSELAMDAIKTHYQNNPEKLSQFAAQKKYLDSLSQTEVLYTLFNVEANTQYSDYGAIYNGTDVIFSSTRGDTNFNGLYSWNNQPYLNIFKASTNFDTGELSAVEPLSQDVESNFHDASLIYSLDKSKVYFTRNFIKKAKLLTNQEDLSNTQILMGTVSGNAITDIKPMSFNSEEFSCGHPAISADGKLFYFVSDMPGGYGQTDMYVAELNEDGTVNTPMNLGATINTAGREMFPTVIDSTLYFASDGHYGFGGLDIYQSDIKSKKEYSIPQNLGEPVNSNMDDFSYTFNPETMTGYISSNRAGGKGDDDIYFFTKLDPIIEQTYSGYVFDERTGEPLAEADVILKDVFDVPVVEFSTDETGFYKFTLAPNSQYAVSATKPNYNKKVLEFATDNERDKVMENNNIYLTNFEALTINDDGVEKIDVEPIYFDYDKYAITPQAEVELNKVLFAMTEFPEIKIKIESHTDSRGSDSYNLKLSDNRAKSTRDYLISKGIDKSRIESAIGYGETQLKNNCSNGVNCTADEHAVNRRSDFIIISK